jgi:hypothetical protein
MFFIYRYANVNIYAPIKNFCYTIYIMLTYSKALGNRCIRLIINKINKPLPLV